MSLRKTLFLSYLLILTSCSTTTLPVSNISTELQHLSYLNNRKISFKVSSPSTQITVGNQYLFVFLPLGSVAISDPREYLFNSIYSELVIGGFKPTADLDGPAITVSPVDISASAFDLLFIRIIRCKVKLTVSYKLPVTGKIETQEIEGDAHGFNRFGFEPQISRIFRKAIHEASLKIIKIASVIKY